ncbi:inhibitor of nuclear factor kappa-B kinase subunit alpha-like [Argonauta hians]
MTGMEGVPENSKWQNEHIGIGSFGFVEKWVNQETGECLAMKRLRLNHEHKPDLLNKWRREIDIMKKLNHKNIISCRDIPDELRYLENKHPILTMEFCSAGNLKKKLKESFCGFSEADVLHFAKDISSAVAYLHMMNIVHRDIKPENIVLQEINNQIVYKIIDLGLAKDLNEGSFCKSFVGTILYLAPEVYKKDKYSHTADYWSLGSVVFEVIAGYQPFRHSKLPVKWYEEVQKKKDHHISIQCLPDETIEFLSELPKCTKLCYPLKQSFEKWMKTMLRLDPNTRGNDTKGETNKQWCFQQLDKILEAKILRIYHVAENSLLCYMLEPNQTIEDIQNIISLEADVPLIDQTLVMQDGQPINKTQLAEDFLSKNIEEVSLFLFDKRNPYCKAASITSVKPIQGKLKDLNEQNQRNFAEILYACTTIEDNARHFVQSIATGRKLLVREHTEYLNNDGVLCDFIPRIFTKTEYLAKSLELNKEKLKELRSRTLDPVKDIINTLKKMESEAGEIKENIQSNDTKNYFQVGYMDEITASEINMDSLYEKYDNLKSKNDYLKSLYNFESSENSEVNLKEKVKGSVEDFIAEWQDLAEMGNKYHEHMNSSKEKFLQLKYEIEERNNRIDCLLEVFISCNWNLMKYLGANGEESLQPTQLTELSSMQSMELINENKSLRNEFEKLLSNLPDLQLQNLER